MSLLDRLMRASVERAGRMQPRRVQRTVDEYLYAAPSSKDDVEAIAVAAERLHFAGFAPGMLASVAVRRSSNRATVIRPGSDLRAVDNRMLETVELESELSMALAGVRGGSPSAVWAYPPQLMALAEMGFEPAPVSRDLAEVAGPVEMVAGIDEVTSGLSVVLGRGVISGHQTAVEAVTRMEAAEALAAITISIHQMRSEP